MGNVKGGTEGVLVGGYMFLGCASLGISSLQGSGFDLH